MRLTSAATVFATFWNGTWERCAPGDKEGTASANSSRTSPRDSAPGAVCRGEGRRQRDHDGTGDGGRPARHPGRRDGARRNGRPERRIARGPERQDAREREWYQQIVDQVVDSSLMKRYGTLDEQAAAITFLASDEASYITGTVLPVAGGDLG